MVSVLTSSSCIDRRKASWSKHEQVFMDEEMIFELKEMGVKGIRIVK